MQRLVAALSRKRYFFKILEPARDREFGEDVSNMSKQALFGSTLAKLLLGLDRPEEGRILVDWTSFCICR